MPLVPEYQAMLEALAAEPGPPITAMTPEEARALYRMMRPVNDDLAVGEVVERRVPGPAGEVPLRIYRPQSEGPHPLLLYLHGGGWVIGDLETADAACRDLCATAGCLVVSVDYRLAPEHRFPAAVDDCYAALEWVADNGDALGGNGRLGVTGESAGGNLAAVLCLKARDEGGPRIDFQLLLYPVVDDDLGRPSYRENATGYILETDTMSWFWDHYCPDPASRSHPPRDAAEGRRPQRPATGLGDDRRVRPRCAMRATCTRKPWPPPAPRRRSFATTACFTTSSPPRSSSRPAAPHSRPPAPRCAKRSPDREMPT